MNIFKQIEKQYLDYMKNITPQPAGIMVSGKRLWANNEMSELNLYYQKISNILLAEAKELNSGVMEKDGTVWHNLN